MFNKFWNSTTYSNTTNTTSNDSYLEHYDKLIYDLTHHRPKYVIDRIKKYNPENN